MLTEAGPSNRADVMGEVAQVLCPPAYCFYNRIGLQQAPLHYIGRMVKGCSS